MNFRLTKSSLNFKVYTSPTIPASGTENDIVIISSTPMENWILSSDAPTGEPMNNGDVWIQYSVSGNVFDIMNQHDFMLAITKIYQYVSGTWVSVDARRYVGGVWDVVSSAFSATINITYPANSNCVVTNSGGQTVASDTNTGTSAKTWTATVNAKGTYTITATATDGSGKTKSTTVSITAEGQVETAELVYRLDIFKAGQGAVVPLSSFTDKNGIVTIGTDKITISKTSQSSCGAAVFTTDSVDLSPYHTLYADVALTPLSDQYRCYLYVSESTPSTREDLLSEVSGLAVTRITASSSRVSLDISSVSSGYVTLGNFGYGSATNIWAEY